MALAGLRIEDRSNPNFVYGRSATKNAQPFAGLIVHHTADRPIENLVAYGQRMDRARGGAFGYHFYIGKDGRIVQGAPLDKRTNHIKPPSHSARTGAKNLSNANAIGISLVGAEHGATPEQRAAALELSRALMDEHGIGRDMVFGHGEVQRDRQHHEGADVVEAIRNGEIVLAGDLSREETLRLLGEYGFEASEDPGLSYEDTVRFLREYGHDVDEGAPAKPMEPAPAAPERGPLSAVDLIQGTPSALMLKLLHDHGPEYVRDLINQGLVGSSFGFSDEMTGAANALVSGTEGESFSEEAARYTEAERANIKRFEEENPIASTVAEITGGALALGPIGGGFASGAKSLLGRSGRGLVEGLAAGSVYGAGTADDGDRGMGALTGAGLGAAGGAVGAVIFPPVAKAVGWAAGKLGKAVAPIFENAKYYRPGEGLTDAGRKALATLGYNAEEVSIAMANAFGRRARTMRTPTRDNLEAAARGAELEAQGIPPMRQNTGQSVDDWHFIEAARKGAHGDRVQRLIGEGLGAQDDAVRRRISDIETGLGPGGEPVDRLTAAEITRRGLQDRKTALKNPADEAYAALGFTLADGKATGLLPRVFRSVLNHGVDEIAPMASLGVDTPLANRAMAFASQIAKRAKKGAVPGKEIDRLRQLLNKKASSQNTNDIDALRLMRIGFNDWLEAVVDRGLLMGEREAVDAIRRAPKLWRAYMAEFDKNAPATKFIAKMVDAEASPEQVANWLYGATAMGGGGMTSRQARKLKDVLGADSAEWQSVKQGMWNFLTSGRVPPGPQKLTNDLRTFLTGDRHRMLAAELFTKEERRQMMLFANALKKLIPPDGTVNYSNSAISLTAITRDGFGAAANALAMGAAVKGGPIAGAVAGSTTRALKDHVMHRGDWLRAKAIAAGIPDQSRRTSVMVPVLSAQQIDD